MVNRRGVHPQYGNSGVAGMSQGMDGRRKWLSQLLYGLSLLFLVLGLVHLGWAVWPTPTDAVTFNIPAGVLPGAPADSTFASLSSYALRMNWPRWMRMGEEGLLVLQLADLDGSLDPPVMGQAAQVVLVEPVIPGIRVYPSGQVQANLADEQHLDLSWTVEGLHRGDFPGKVYVSFGFYDDVMAELVPVPLAVVDVSIQVTALWGLPSGMAVWFGLVGMVFWGIFFILGRIVSLKQAGMG